MQPRTVFLVVLALVSSVSVAAGGAVAGPVEQRDGGHGECEFPMTLTDATGEAVTIEERPERIVTLQPSDAQTVWEIGAEDRVVGMPVTRYTSYLPDRDGRTNVKTDDGAVTAEAVVGTDPDLVLAANTTPTETVSQLKTTGLTVYHFEKVRSLEEIATNVETVGRLLGDCEAADEAADEFRHRVETVEQAAESADSRPAVLYYFFDFTTGSNTHVHDVIETAGGRNVAAEAGLDGYKRLNAEKVVSSDPEWIVYPSDATVPAGEPYAETTAIRRNQTVELDSNAISQPGPRVVGPLTKLAKTWHSEEFAAANETVTAELSTETGQVEKAEPSTDTAEPTTHTDTFGPGFGTVVSIGALVVVTLIAVRRRQ